MTEQEFNRIKEIAEQANSPILLRLADGERRFSYLESRQLEHEQILKGNGSRDPGLVVIVDRLNSSNKAFSKLFWLGVGAGVTVGTGGFVAAIVFLIRSMH